MNMMKKSVLPGEKNNLLTVIEEVEREIQYARGYVSKIRKVKCICECGNIVITRLSSFRTGYAKSCGCIKKVGRFDKEQKSAYRHPLHRVWSNMIQRCSNKNHHNFKRYGGKGVRVCEEWFVYNNFYEWAINNGWEMGKKLDKDISGQLLYSPETCVFVDAKTNMNHTSRNRVFYLKGERYTLQQLSELFLITRTALERKLKKGMPIEEALKKRGKYAIEYNF